MTRDERALDQCPPFVPLSTCYLYCECDAMRRRNTGRLILSIRFAFVASAAALGQTAQTVDIAGDWILALERYGQTGYQRPVPA
jgi:hypothetical protein